MNDVALQHALETIYASYDRLRGHGRATGEVFETIIQNFYRIVLEPGDTAVDLGACLGRHTSPLARCVGPSGLVLAFEPIPACAARVEERLAKEKTAKRVKLHRVALARERGTATFFVIDGKAVGNSGLRQKDSYPGGVVPTQIQVETAPLDEFISGDRKVRFVKVDLEGGEFHALQSGRRMLAEHRPVVVFESAFRADSRRYGYGAEEFFGFFKELDFELKDILGCPFRESQALRYYPHYLVAYPREDAGAVSDALSAAILESTFGPRWFGLEAQDERGATGAAEMAAGHS